MVYIALASIIAGAFAAFAFGAVWYMLLSKPWMKASGLTDADVKLGRRKLYVFAFLCVLVVSFMIRYLQAQLVVLGPSEGAIQGLAIGLGIAVPWILMNYAFGRRPIALMAIDGTYAAVGCCIIGTVQALF